MDITSDLLSSYSASLSYSALPPDTVHETKRRIIDSLGCAMGGFPSEPAKIARRLASMTGSTFPSRVLGSGERTAPDMAAFTNTVMVRYLDCNDTSVSIGGGHPSDMLAAVLAVADPLQAPGSAVITGTVLAYEIYCGFAEKIPMREKGWDQGIFTVIGSACAAARMLGLTAKQTAHAISLAITPNVPLNQTRVGELSMWKGCATAAATRNGVFAAMLAREGMEGPREPFEGHHGLWKQTTGPCTLGPLGGGTRPFKINETTLKFFPSQIHTQVPIALALKLRQSVRIEEIEAVKIATYEGAWRNSASEPEKWDPKTRETADHSLPYAVSVALRDGAITPSSFSAERIRDPELRPLMNRVSVRENPDFTRRYPEAQLARIELVTSSGQHLVEQASFPKGHPKNPLSDAELEDKFHRLAQAVLNAEQRQKALEVLWKLEEVEDIGVLFDRFQIQPKRL